ncbi:MAG TPA: serine hydrolase domain-containing protein [Vicinamibacterales bacterium]|nr:serine hydrolase domain-containing protein [Vicinamibacterales bacterium]
MRKLLASAFVVVLAASTLSAQRVIFTPNGVLPILESYLEALRVQASIPGMSAAVVKDGVIIWEKGYGFQNATARIRATPDTPYMVGDASAILASALLLQCVEQRRLDLDRPLGSFGITIPEPQATLRQLLSHTTSAAGAEPFTYVPARYAQLGAVMEWCAPQPYRKSVSHRILNRLAMRDSVPGTDLINPDLPLPAGLYDPAELQRYRAVLDRIAVPYRVDMRGRAERTDLPTDTMSAVGGLVSTVRDLARLDTAFDERSFLLETTIAEAWQPVMTTRGTAAPTGLGWFVQSYRGQRVVWHFGMITNAYSSLIVKLPDDRLTFILLANSDRLSSPFQLESGDISRSLFATLFLKLVT